MSGPRGYDLARPEFPEFSTSTNLLLLEHNRTTGNPEKVSLGTSAELNVLDGGVAGTVVASKVLVAGSDRGLATLGPVTFD